MARSKNNQLFLFSLSALFVLLAAACEFPGLPNLDQSQARLIPFSDCESLQSHLQQEALRTVNVVAGLDLSGSTYEPFGFMGSGFAPGTTSGSGGAPLPSYDYSTTNNQEEGVHEADLFQVDATHAFAIHDNRLVIIEAMGSLPAGDVLMQITDARQVADFELGGRAIEMILHGNRLLILTRVQHSEIVLKYNVGPERAPNYTLVQAKIFDVSDRSNPQLVREVAVEGEYLASRRVDDNLYIVARAMLGVPEASPDARSSSNWHNNASSAIQSASLDAWMPYYYNTNFRAGVEDHQLVARCNCTSAYTSPTATGDDVLGIYSFNISDDSSEVNTTTIVGDGSLVYGSRESIIVALTNYSRAVYDDPVMQAEQGPSDEEYPATFVHRFGMNQETGHAEYDASGVVHGWILNQFSISEHQGFVRIATQRNRGHFDNASMVFVLESSRNAAPTNRPLMQSDDPDEHYLNVVGELTDIGKWEDLYAVRWLGEIGYLVTFRATDPLWTIDVSNPYNPRIRGELEVPGFTTYLHPISGGRLIGIGQNQDGAGLDPYGIKLSLFDVSDLDNPRALIERSEGGVGTASEALTEHRAFRFIPHHNLLAVPMSHTNERGLYLYRIGAQSIDSIGRIDHTELIRGATFNTDVRRAYYIGNYLYSYSNAGVTITDLTSLSTPAVVAF